MARSKNLFASLTSELTTTTLISSSLFPSASTATGSRLYPGADSTLKSIGFDAKDLATGIQFGSPSSSRATATSSSSGAWSTILKHTLSGGGPTGTGTGGGGLGLLGSVTGLGGLISGLSHVFGGGRSTPPPLSQVQLPVTQQQTISIGEPASLNQGSSNVVYQSAQIAQAVKQALLNSSSLNDVIAEM
jgi:hypothetical protein